MSVQDLPELYPRISAPIVGRDGIEISRGPDVLDGWDLAQIGDSQIPGISRVTSGGIEVRFDPKTARGRDGGKPTTVGLMPQRFTLEVEVWTDNQLKALYDICRKILPYPGQKPDPLFFDHPQIRHLGGIKVMVLGAGVLMRDHEKRYHLPISLFHWLVPTGKGLKATNTPVRAVPNKRAELDRKQNNPTPTEQASVGKPPSGLHS